jgi:hypothetical protein
MNERSHQVGAGDTAQHTPPHRQEHQDQHQHPRQPAVPVAHPTDGTADASRRMAERRRLTRLAVSATLHCLTGCAIGEVLGMVVGTGLGLTNVQTVVLAAALAFVFGYALTFAPVLRSGLGLRAALGVTLAADTVSITVMEVTDNAFMLAIPGALQAGLVDPLFWGSLAASLVVAFVVTVPVNRALIRRGKGHAVVHQHHH